MRVRVRAVATFAAALALSCGRPATHESMYLELAGRNPALLIARDGRRHVVYIDPAGRLMHRLIDGGDLSQISPAGDAPKLRGENTPILAERDKVLLVLYPTDRELRVQESHDGGRMWTGPRRIDGDTIARGHNFADLTVTTEGNAVASWLDSRSGRQGVQLALLHHDTGIVQTQDAIACQCCRTALFTSSDGRVWLAYRDLAEGDIRNIVYAISTDGGRTFAPRGVVVDDHWSVSGCPDSGPRFAETDDGTVWLTWFNGAAKAIEIAAAAPGKALEPRGVVASSAVDHPEIGTLPDGRLVVFYETMRGNRRAVEARISDAQHAHWQPPVAIANDGMVPRYVRSGNTAMLAYTGHIAGAPRLYVLDPLRRLR
jgi:hypothetical protein